MNKYLIVLVLVLVQATFLFSGAANTKALYGYGGQTPVPTATVRPKSTPKPTAIPNNSVDETSTPTPTPSVTITTSPTVTPTVRTTTLVTTAPMATEVPSEQTPATPINWGGIFAFFIIGFGILGGLVFFFMRKK